MSVATEKATFGAGCFWGVEAAFRQVHGVTSTAVGYMGGHLKNPTYRDVCTDQTGHAEVVEVTFDRSQVSYADLLKVFWENHDPTQFNRQGPDYGKQYRTVIFFHSPEQEAAARVSKDDARSVRKVPATDRHGNHSGGGILAGGGIPPAVFGKARLGELSHQVRYEAPCLGTIGLTEESFLGAAPAATAALELARGLAQGETSPLTPPSVPIPDKTVVLTL